MPARFVWSPKFSMTGKNTAIQKESISTLPDYTLHKRHYLCVITVIDPTNLIGRPGIEWGQWDPNVFVENKKVWQKYMHMDEDILVLFTNDDNSLNTDFDIDMNNQTLTVKEKHSYVGADALLKTYKYVNKLFSYDYLVSATSSSFFVLPKLKDELMNNTGKTIIYKGRPLYHQPVPYISGSGIVMSRDVAQMLVDGTEYICKDINSGRSVANDVAFGRFLYEKHNISADPKEWWYDFDDNSVDDLDEKIKNTEARNIMHYRIKNPANRLHYDTIIMNHLYRYYYCKEEIYISITK